MQIMTFDHLYTEEEKARFAQCRSAVPQLSYRPLISIVVPVYRTPVRLLNEMISSVMAQSYPEWELCIANASGGEEELCRVLEEWQKQDHRIKVRSLEKNLGISGNTNACLEMAEGEYTAMLDHDDLLTENALCEVVMCLQGDEADRADFLYSDQDMVDEQTSKRFNPLYKPAWSKDMMYSGNYITHFSVLRTSLVREIGGWDTETDGAQDWDLFLKAAEHTDKILGIPRILYHWRMASTSTASSMETKSYALDAQLRAVKGHLARMGEPQADVRFYNRDIFKMQVLWNRKHEKDISVIVFDESKRGSLKLLVSLVKVALRMKEREIIVVSEDENRLEGLTEEGCVTVRVSAGSRWPDGYQAGSARAAGEILLFLTDRALPMTRQTVTELADWAFYDKVAVAGPKIMGEGKTLREMGIVLEKDGPVPMFRGCYEDGTTDRGKNYWYRNVHAVDNSCFAIRRRVHEEAGGFLQKQTIGGKQMPVFPMIEYCLRLEQMGYRHVVSPYAQIRLLGSGGTMCDSMNEQIQETQSGREAWETLRGQFQLPDRDGYYPRA